MSNTSDSAKDFLSANHCYGKVYVIGIFQNGITVTKQQTRALNLIFCLHEEGLLPEGSKIGIIGGGIAGVTCALGLLKLGHFVTLFEKQPILMGVQFGNFTRNLHPNIYDWPDDMTSYPYAYELPFLNWRAGLTGNVIDEIFAEFKSEINLEGTRERIEMIFNTKITTPVREVSNKLEIRYGDSSKLVDLVIYATGYGAEKQNKNLPLNFSYWRNEDRNQINLATPPYEILITGCGDGGLNDLFRMKIFNFNLNKVIKYIDDCTSNTYNLTSELQKIKIEWESDLSNKISKKDWLYKKFLQLYEDGKLNEFANKIEKECNKFKENHITLNSPKTNFSEILNLEKISFLHALIVFTLKMRNKFDYVGEVVEPDGPNSIKLKGKDGVTFDSIIYRRGPDKIEALLQNGIDTKLINNLEAKQAYSFSFNKGKRLWPPGWWSSRIKEKNVVSEFISPETKLFCSTTINHMKEGIEKMFKKHKLDAKKLRITLHRIVNINNESVFQQICPYFGDEVDFYKNVGRVFDMNLGVVGLSARSKKAIMLYNNKKGKEFEKIWLELNLKNEKVRTKIDEKNYFFAFPINTTTSSGSHITNLVVYLDFSFNSQFNHFNELNLFVNEEMESMFHSLSVFLKSQAIKMTNSSAIIKIPELSNNDDFNLNNSTCIKSLPVKSFNFDYSSFNLFRDF